MADAKNLKNSLLLVKTGSDDITDAVTSLTGWTDLSAELAGEITFNLTASNERLKAEADEAIGRILPGDVTGTVDMVLIKKLGETPDASAFFEDLYSGVDRRYQFVFQPDRPALTSGDPPVVTPAPSAANPQYTGSALMSDLEPWQGSNVSADSALIHVVADLDKDYRRRVSA